MAAKQHSSQNRGGNKPPNYSIKGGAHLLSLPKGGFYSQLLLARERETPLL